MKQGFLDKLIERMDRVEPAEVQNYLLRLVQEKGFLENVFDALKEGVIVLDREGKVNYINQAACGIFGVTGENAIGAALGDRIRGLNWQELISEGKTVSRDLEINYPETRYLNFYLSPIEVAEVPDEAEEKNLGYVLLVRDETENRRLTKEKMESERLNALTLLAAGVAHELGNPLNSLNIHLQLLERKLRNAPLKEAKESQEILQIAQGEIKRLDSIITQFLEAIRPTQPRKELANVNELVEEAVRFLGVEFEGRKVLLQLELSDQLPLIALDIGQIKQALYNLLRNALQSIKSQKGQVVIRSAADAQELRIEVEDNGAGMRSEILGNAFDPYFSTKQSGSGLGLLIVRRIAREHGGEISLESEENKGTKVTLHFPLADRRLRLLGEGASEVKPE